MESFGGLEYQDDRGPELKVIEKGRRYCKFARLHEPFNEKWLIVVLAQL